MVDGIDGVEVGEWMGLVCTIPRDFPGQSPIM